MDLLEIVHDRGHLTGDSDELKPFPCHDPNCDKSFNRKSDLQRHYRIHTNERPYKCCFHNCGKAFIQRSALTVHHRVHTGEKPHKCEYIGCGKCFSDSSSLARHRRIHTGKRPYRCQVSGCGKSFCRKTTLTKHQRRTHRVRDPQGSYPEEYLNSSEQDADGSETEVDTPRNSVPPPSRTRAPRPTSSGSGAKMYNVKRTGITRRVTPSSLQPTAHHMFRQESVHGHRGPLTPHSPVSVYSTPSTSSPSLAFSGTTVPSSFSPACDENYHYAQHHPPTPRSPHHHQPLIMVKQESTHGLGHHHQPSEMMYTSADDYNTGRPLDAATSATATTPTSQPQQLRILCKAPGTYDLIAEAQAMQHSPGSLSSCSSISTTSHASADYFCDAPSFQDSYSAATGAVDVYPVHLQQIAHFQPCQEGQAQIPLTHVGLGAQFQTPQQQQPQYLMPVHHHQYHPSSSPPTSQQPPVQQQQQQIWLEVPPYQHQLLQPAPEHQLPNHRPQDCYAAPPQHHVQEMMYIKQEPVNMMATPQGSFCE